MHNYGVINDIGILKNKKEAIKYYKMAINKNYSESMYNYARMLETGDGIEMNKKEAFNYYKMAANLSNPKAMNSCAIMLKEGDGIPENKEEAIKHYKMAIERGNFISKYNISFSLPEVYIPPSGRRVQLERSGGGIETHSPLFLKYYLVNSLLILV